MKQLFYLFMSITLLFDILGDYFAKRWSMDNNTFTLALLMVFYAASGVFWGISLKHGELSKGTLIINLLNVMVIIGVGVGLFGEKLTLENKIGIGLGILSLYLIQK